MKRHRNDLAVVVCAMVWGLLGACAPVKPSHGPQGYISHVVAGPKNAKGDDLWHSCAGGGSCREGWACVKDGCEWCGDGAGVQTRCSNGND